MRDKAKMCRIKTKDAAVQTKRVIIIFDVDDGDDIDDTYSDNIDDIGSSVIADDGINDANYYSPNGMLTASNGITNIDKYNFMGYEN